MAVNEGTRNRLLSLARERCCLHRFNWLHRPDGPRWETLHVHHVVFRSLGGGDQEDNLIPLCPACHDFVHKSFEAGEDWLTNEKLKSVWDNWKELPRLVGGMRRVVKDRQYRSSWPGFAPIVGAEKIVAEVILRTYAIDVSFETYVTENYKDFRTRVASDLFQSVSFHDKWCPLRVPPGNKWDNFHLS